MKAEIFQAYDVRGLYPSEINEEVVYTIVRAYVDFLKPTKVALGRDVRLSGENLYKAACRAFCEAGVEVINIGVVTTDMLYFAVANYGLDGGISVTASHDPAEYNGLKMVGAGARPLSMDGGLADIRNLALKNEFEKSNTAGEVEDLDILDDYIAKVLSFVDVGLITHKKIVANPNFGAAGKVVDRLANKLNLEIIKLNFEEDGRFPKGQPDPSLTDNQTETVALVKKSGADFGVAWDADADRCFFFDETGAFVSAYYEMAILAQIVLDKYPGGKIIHDTRLVWAIQDLAKLDGGIALTNKAGHAFIKDRMRKETAVFGGETSGHFYFKDFYYCDNGMIPFVLILQRLSENGQQMSALVNPLRQKYPISGEINFKNIDTAKKLVEIESHYTGGKIERIDGLTVDYPDWRFNVRAANTEPLLRLNIEAKTKGLVEQKVQELTDLIKS